MYLKSYLTEYDNSITSELNMDPLGLQVIWSQFGREIFHNRVNSISNDVRNYTINLFHHYIIRDITENIDSILSSQLSKKYTHEKMFQFKKACLVYLENIFVYSIVESEQNSKEVDASGVLGITKARRNWEKVGGSPKLKFSDSNDSFVLVRQTLLGISGRYKTPLIHMSFFDNQYNYKLHLSEKNNSVWEITNKLIDTSPLKALYLKVKNHLLDILKLNEEEPNISFSDIPSDIKEAYIMAFRSPETTGAYSKDFWLQVTDLNKGVSGALLRIIEKDGFGLSKEELFEIAKKDSSLTKEEMELIENIEVLEPFLADVDLLFSLILEDKSQSIQNVIEKWRDEYGRNENTLSDQAFKIGENFSLLNILGGTSERRMKSLLVLKDKNRVSDQLNVLYNYHKEIMSQRRQSSWISITSKEKYKLNINARKISKGRKESKWIHSYYIPQFRNFVKGLKGIEDEVVKGI